MALLLQGSAAARYKADNSHYDYVSGANAWSDLHKVEAG